MKAIPSAPRFDPDEESGVEEDLGEEEGGDGDEVEAVDESVLDMVLLERLRLAG